jgi:hypothetical protein
MIVKEFYKTREDGVNLYRTYSDEGFYLLQNETGVEYSEAVDVESSKYTYSETDKPIETPDNEATEADYRNALESLGGDV